MSKRPNPSRRGRTARPKARTPARTRRKKKAAPARRRQAAAAPRPPGRTDSGLAPGMQPINSYLAVANVTASIDFLEQAFAFSRGVVLTDPDGLVRYAEMRHQDAVVMLVRKGDEATATSGAAALYTYVEDVDRALAAARTAGAGVEEAADKPWGDRVAAVTDPDGYRWVLATFKKLAPFT